REMRRLGGVAYEHDIAHDPGGVGNPREDEPDGGYVQMAGVRHLPVTVELTGEQLFAKADGLVLFHPVEAGPRPRIAGGLDDEGRGVGVEPVGMGLEPAPRRLLEDEGEGVEQLVGAEPDEPVAANVDVGPEMIGVGGTDAAVDAVADDDQVSIAELLEPRHLGLEPEVDPQSRRTPLQDVQEPLARDAGEAVAAGADDPVPEMNVDIVPVGERLVDFLRRRTVGPNQVVERLGG